LYQPITLDKLEQATLPKRTDTKFVLPISQLGLILQQTVGDYAMLYIKESGIQRYHTLYFDTPDHQFYLAHHNGRLNRYKIRIRRYIDSDFCCLEVKFKNNFGQTVKSRIPIPKLYHDLTSLACLENVKNFMQQTFPCHHKDLKPNVSNHFQRITLVHKHDIERVTIDLSLHFSSPMQNDTATPDLVENREPISTFQTISPLLALVEIKQERFSMRSSFLRQMRTAHININPTSFSKYCIGATLLNPHLKANNFKPILLHAQKVASQMNDYQSNLF